MWLPAHGIPFQHYMRDALKSQHDKALVREGVDTASRDVCAKVISLEGTEKGQRLVGGHCVWNEEAAFGNIALGEVVEVDHCALGGTPHATHTAA
jgi:hypothetical protein